MPNETIEVQLVGRVVSQPSEPYEGTGRNGRAFSVRSVLVSGMVYVGQVEPEQALDGLNCYGVRGFQVTKFKQGEKDQLFERLGELERGDEVSITLTMEWRPVTTLVNGKERERWALLPGQPLKVQVLTPASVVA